MPKPKLSLAAFVAAIHCGGQYDVRDVQIRPAMRGRWSAPTKPEESR
jgi:hypothetical protein